MKSYYSIVSKTDEVEFIFSTLIALLLISININNRMALLELKRQDLESSQSSELNMTENTFSHSKKAVRQEFSS